MKHFENFVNRAAIILNTVSGTAMAVLMLLITLNVILRAVFKSPIPGTYDYTGFLTIIIIGCGIAYCSVLDGHIELTFLYDKLSLKLKKIISIAGNLFSFLLMTLFSYSLFSYALSQYQTKGVSITTKTPLYIFSFITAFCFVIFTLTIMIKLLDGIISSKENT